MRVKFSHALKAAAAAVALVLASSVGVMSAYAAPAASRAPCP